MLCARLGLPILMIEMPHGPLVILNLAQGVQYLLSNSKEVPIFRIHVVKSVAGECFNPHNKI